MHWRSNLRHRCSTLVHWRGNIVVRAGNLPSRRKDAHPSQRETRSDPGRDARDAGRLGRDLSVRVYAGDRRIVGQPDHGIVDKIAGSIPNLRPRRRCLSHFERSSRGIERDDYLSLGGAASAAAEDRQGKQRPEKPRRDC